MSNMTSLEKSCFYSNFVYENIYRRGTFYAKEDRHCSFFLYNIPIKQQWTIIIVINSDI